MALTVRVWCNDRDLGGRIEAALAPTAQVSPGVELAEAPPGSLAHLAVESGAMTGSVFVVAGAAQAGGLRSVLLSDPGGPGGLVDAADVETRLAPTVAAVAAGQVAVPAELVAAARRPLLTNREKQVLALVVMGLANAEIAGRLHLSESTVKSHLFSSYRKLGVNSRGEATRLILDREAGVGLGILQISEEPQD